MHLECQVSRRALVVESVASKWSRRWLTGGDSLDAHSAPDVRNSAPPAPLGIQSHAHTRTRAVCLTAGPHVRKMRKSTSGHGGSGSLRDGQQTSLTCSGTLLKTCLRQTEMSRGLRTPKKETAGGSAARHRLGRSSPRGRNAHGLALALAHATTLAVRGNPEKRLKKGMPLHGQC